MNFETFMNRMSEAKDFSCIENAYSHIVYDIFNITLDTVNYMLIDTSTYKRTNSNPDALVPNDAIAVPDFVIGSRANDIGKVSRKGCIECKYSDKDINNANQLTDKFDRFGDHFREKKQQRGYLSLYQNVIYTNGWIWRFFSGKKQEWCFDFSKVENQKNSYYGEFLAALCGIKWD